MPAFVPDERFDGEIEDISKHITHKTLDLDTLDWKGVWIDDFLKFCEKEGLPVDFISTYPYPTDFALDGQQQMKGRSRYVDSLKEDMDWLVKRVKESGYADAKLHLTGLEPGAVFRIHTLDIEHFPMYL